jgi:hypothetical protein
MHPRRDALFPWYGYVLVNAVVLAVTLGVYWLAVTGRVSTPGPSVERPGVAGWLLFIPLSFLLASLYDALVDRYLLRRRLRMAAREEADAAPAPRSRESSARNLTPS